MKISFVIPCFRSEHMIRSVVNELVESVKETEYDYEIILVNDCSPDKTFEEIRRICAEEEKIKGVNLAKNFGQHAALMAGFRLSTGDIIVCLDDDGQTPANEFTKLVDKIINEDYDVVYAAYKTKKQTRFRNFGSNINKKMLEILLDKPEELEVSSYFAARRFIIDEVIKYEHPYPYVIGLVLRSTNKICNVPVNHRERTYGTSGYTLKRLITLWLNGFTAFSVKPLRFAELIGAVAAVSGFVYAIWNIVKKIVNPVAPVGWASTISVILLIGGTILCVLGMMGEYIGRMYICINKAPQYVIKEIINEGNA